MLARVPESGLALVQPPSSQSGGFKPREFQTRMVREIYGHIRNKEQRILAIAATGAGKTVLATIIIKDATQNAKKPRRCVFLVRLNCLLDQTAATFRKFGIRTSIYQANRKVDWSADVIIASLQTIGARRKKQSVEEMFNGCSLFVADEAHESSFDKSYIAIEEAFLPQGAIFLGLTGSPWRTSPKQGLCERYDVVVVGPQPPELVKAGAIVPARIFHPGDAFDPDSLDVSNTGDYVQSQVEEQAMRQASLTAVVRHWIESAGDRTTVAFCPGVKTAEALCAEFVSQGVAAEWQCGNTPLGKNGKAEHEQGILTRASQDYRLANGLTKVLCNVMTLTAGWDVPEIELVIFYLETLSRCKWVQATGRGARTCDRIGKTDFWIYDYGSNAQKRFGSPTGFQDYSIEPRGKNKPSRKLNDKACPDCGALNSPFARVCVNCDYEFVKDLDAEEPIQFELDIEVQLTEFLDETAKKQLRYLRSIRKDCFKNNDSPDEAAASFSFFYGFAPPSDWFKGAVFGARPKESDRQLFVEYLERFKGSNKWSQEWFDHHLFLEFGDSSPEALKPKFAKGSQWWEVLGLPQNSGRSAFKSAYRELAREYHPDVCSDPDADEKMKALNWAWEECCRRFGK